MTRSVWFVRRDRVVDPEVVSDHRRGLATPTDSASNWLSLEAAVAGASAGSAVSMERQETSAERVID